jgi:diguanylate cyclase (GGDEF)-like protein
MAAKAKILLIEDSPLEARQVKRILEKTGYDVYCTDKGIEGMKMVTTLDPDVVLLDVVLPDISGYEVCRWIKVRDDTKGIPVIMLTVKGKLKEKVAGLQIGADDYLPKPFQASELNARIYASIRTREFQEELKKKNTQLEDLLQKVEIMAITDPGTGLFNRRHFQMVLQKEFTRMKRYHEAMALMMIDIDHFKSINDTYGHQAGDQVLAEVAKIIASQFREVDTVARYGGEEFVVLLPESAKAAAAAAAERILQEVESHPFKNLKGSKRKVTVSIGIAGLPDPLITNPDELVRCSDTALYRAKQAGRNRVEVGEGKDLTPSLS